MSVVLALNIQPPRLVSRDEHGLEAFFLPPFLCYVTCNLYIVCGACILLLANAVRIK
jgi:hypothetical protein